jgi:hypothetical protein
MDNILSCSDHTPEKQQREKATVWRLWLAEVGCSLRAKVKQNIIPICNSTTDSIATAKMAILEAMRTMLKFLCYLIVYRIFRKTLHIQGFAVKQKIISRLRPDRLKQLFSFYTYN